MVKIQIDLNQEENQMLEVYKVTMKCQTKADAIKSIITERGKPMLEAINKHREVERRKHHEHRTNTNE